ncbi:MAG: Release factor glutamine methyltransferase [Chlamydiales bacterium]|nr:Release factor glutamine methyltransferase [Chlamydiales bacterium]MCH9619105.1 Release factor glutamine methyltransferase [Chlamydiales bacterium]MCH9622367.1 Release factor glutamine methyltransferase [Chlamydiales bacterium]
MKSLLQIIGHSSTFLEKKGVPNARRMAEEVLSDVLDVKRLDLYLHFDRPLNEKELARCRAAILLRGERKPAPYIKGEIEFAGVRLKITPDVLIPRPETELLVEKIAKEPLEGRLFEPCTGSGAIAIALKKRFPHLEVFASDLSSKALEVARANAKAADVKITFLEGDLLAPFEGVCDYLVCNPPYLSNSEYEKVDPEVKWEPKMALVGGESGFEFYQRLKLEGVVKHKAWFELGMGQGEGVKEIFQSQGFQCHVESDWAGHDRFFFLEID